MHTATGRKIVLLERTTSPLIYGVRRTAKNGAEPGIPRPDSWAVAIATLLTTSAFGVFFTYFLYLSKVDYSEFHSVHPVYYKHVTWPMLVDWPAFPLRVMVFVLLFIIVYPLMGLIVAGLCEKLGEWIAHFYVLKRGERWHPNILLIFCSSWPVTVWAVPLLALAVVLGIIYGPFLWKPALENRAHLIRQDRAAVG